MAYNAPKRKKNHAKEENLNLTGCTRQIQVTQSSIKQEFFHELVKST